MVYEKNIHIATWQLPKSKQWHCIDYIVTKQKGRSLCLDVSVKRGAECNPDHHFLCETLRRRWKVPKPGRNGKQCVRYDVSKLLTDCMDIKEKHLMSVMDKAGDRWPVDGLVEDKWQALCSTLVESADEVLGCCKGKQSDWFLESADVLNPFLKDRNDAYT